VEASSDDDARGGGVARGRRGARRDATLARADEPLLAAHFKFRFQPVDVEAFRETEDGSGGDEGGEAFEVEETPATPK